MQSSQRDINEIYQHLSEAVRSDSSDPWDGQVFHRDPGKPIHWGQGVVVRNIDDGLETDTLVVPGTFWHDDIYPPNQIYPWGTNIFDGSGAWFTPTLAVAIGPEHFYGNNGIFNSPDLQAADWYDGVWYAHDSNSCDQRARYIKWTDGTGDHEQYDCPGAMVNLTKETPGNPYTFHPDSHYRGSGYAPAGNPDCGYGGGGTGMHVRWNNQQVKDGNRQIDYQINGFKEDPLLPRFLFAGYSCQIDYSAWNSSTSGKMGDSVEGWRPWIQRFREGAEALQKPVCAWAADLAIGWMNNPRPMITLQNALWVYREEWCDSSSDQPSNPNSFGHYWGWNEIPFDRDKITNKDNCTCYIIVLPPTIDQPDITLKKWLTTNPGCEKGLIEQFDNYENNTHINFQSGVSQVLVVKQIPYDSESPHKVWRRWFCIEEVEILRPSDPKRPLDKHGWKIGQNSVIQKF